jgi:hypothetical protein
MVRVSSAAMPERNSGGEDVNLRTNCPRLSGTDNFGRREVSPISSSLSDLTANPLILFKWYYFLEAKLLSLFKGLKISMMPSPTGC